MPAPFEPEVQQANILDAFLEARKRAADVHRLDRDGIDSVMEFCSTHRDDRPAFALPKSLKSDVKVALRTMDDAALMSLKRAGIGKVKKFIDAQPHDIPGVPVVGQSKPKPTPLQHPPAGLTEHQRLMWMVKARLDRARDFEPFAVCKP